jgi:type IV secretion system protein VirB3
MREPIFPGASRPPMKWGVPLMALVALFMPAFVAVMWLGLLLSWWLAAPVALAAALSFWWMRRTTVRDDQRLHQQWLRLKLALRQPNRRARCGVRSYSPLALRGVRDDWRR